MDVFPLNKNEKYVKCFPTELHVLDVVTKVRVFVFAAAMMFIRTT